MRKAAVLVNGIKAGLLTELNKNEFIFEYHPDYHGQPVSLTMPVKNSPFSFKQFPPFFEGLLPEGGQLEALLRKFKIDKEDYFSQLVKVGQDVVGAVTIEPAP